MNSSGFCQSPSTKWSLLTTVRPSRHENLSIRGHPCLSCGRIRSNSCTEEWGSKLQKRGLLHITWLRKMATKILKYVPHNLLWWSLFFLLIKFRRGS